MRRNGRKIGRWRRLMLCFGAPILALPVVAWFFLPGILESVIVRIVSSAGAGTVAVRVERVGLAHLAAHDFAAEFGPVAIELSRTRVDYGLRTLSSGNINSIAVDGLTVTIDGTKLDRVWLKEWIADESTSIGESARKDLRFTWPIERFTLQNAALVLKFSEAIYQFPVFITAERQPEGAVTFTVESDHPGQRLRLSGAIDTTRMEGEVRIDEANVDLELYRDLATAAGLLTLPVDVDVEAGRVNLGATLQFERGGLAGMTGHVELPRLRARTGDISAEVNNLTLQTQRDHGELIEADLTGAIAASDPALGWSIAPSAFEASLRSDRVLAEARGIVFAWEGWGDATADLTLETTLPGKNESPNFAATIDLLTWDVAGKSGHPASGRVQGNVEELRFAFSELRAPGDVPLVLQDLSGTVRGLANGEPVVSAGASLWMRSQARQLLPAGWTVGDGESPVQLGEVSAHLRMGEETNRGFVELGPAERQFPVVTAPGFQFRPALRVRIDTDTTQVEAQGSLALRAIESTGPESDPGFDNADLRFALPPLSLPSFVSLLSGESLNEDFTMTVEAGVDENGFEIESGWELNHLAGLHAWQVEGETSATLPHCRFDGVEFTDLIIHGPIAAGPVKNDSLLRLADDQPVGLLVRELFASATTQLEWSASSLALPGETQVQWASGSVEKTEVGSPAFSAVARAGIARSEPETLEQAEATITTGGTVDDISITARLLALFEGSELEGDYADNLVIDWANLSVTGHGSFNVAPFTLQSSDVVSRWLPEFPGIVFSGTVSANGTTTYSPGAEFDATLVADLSDGTLSYPEFKARATGLAGSVHVESLAHFRTAPGQEVRFAAAEVRDFAFENGYARFRFDGITRLFIEETRLEVFDGLVSTGPFSLFFPHPDVGVEFIIQSVDAGHLVSRFDLFNGTMTGRLNGRLPVALLAGKPLIGQGYLELDRDFPATLRYDAAGVLTSDLPNKSLVDQINRLGYELAEEGLENLSIKNMHVDLFRRDLPGTPIRIELSGAAETPRAHVPMNITTNVNGSVEEVLDFVMQFVLR